MVLKLEIQVFVPFLVGTEVIFKGYSPIKKKNSAPIRGSNPIVHCCWNEMFVKTDFFPSLVVDAQTIANKHKTG